MVISVFYDQCINSTRSYIADVIVFDLVSVVLVISVHDLFRFLVTSTFLEGRNNVWEPDENSNAVHIKYKQFSINLPL